MARRHPKVRDSKERILAAASSCSAYVLATGKTEAAVDVLHWLIDALGARSSTTRRRSPEGR